MAASEPDSACEQLVTFVLQTLHQLQTDLIAHVAVLEERPDVSHATYGLAFPPASHTLTIAGDVCAHLRERDREVQWAIEIARAPEGGWMVERTLELFPIEDHEPEHELPPIVCSDSAELGRALPQLTAELLSLVSRELPDSSGASPGGT
jgi:hypothetical protein